MGINVRIFEHSKYAIRVIPGNPGPADKSYIEYRVSSLIGNPPIAVVSQRFVSREQEIGREDPEDYRPNRESGLKCAYELALKQARQLAQTDGKITDETQFAQEKPRPQSEAIPGVI